MRDAKEKSSYTLIYDVARRFASRSGFTWRGWEGHIIDERRTLRSCGLANHSDDLRIRDRAASARSCQVDQRSPLGASFVRVRAGTRIREHEGTNQRAMPAP